MRFALGLPLVILGSIVAGCGSARTAVTFSAPTKIKLAGAQTGAHIACQKGPGPAPGHTLPNGRLVVGTVPAPGKGMGWVNGLGPPPNGGISLDLTRGRDGSLLVQCS
jgi:hypothetical protein